MQADTDILEAEVRNYLAIGYRLTSRSPENAQLVLPKAFSFGWAFFWFLFLGVGVFIYVAYYLSKRDTIVYLAIGDDGKIYRQVSGTPGRQPLGTTNVCPHCQYANEQWRGVCNGCGKLLPRRPKLVA